MRSRVIWLSVSLVLVAVRLGPLHGQAPADDKPSSLPHWSPAAATPPPAKSPLAAHADVSARRGADWLARMHDVKGRFLPGLVPSLNAFPEGEPTLPQAAAALALARAARYTADKNYEARATQALLVLLDETVVDPTDAEVRYPPLPSSTVNRLAAAGLLLAAVCELPAPQDDLVKKAEQLAHFLRQRQRADGSLRCHDDVKTDDTEEQVVSCTGPALYGLARSHRLRPAPWKAEALAKAVAFYGSWWRDHKDPTFVATHTPAYVEAFLATKDKAYAECVTAMNDWLCGLQYDGRDPRHPEWLGGFMGWEKGKASAQPPGVASAAYVESLCEASRVVRETADVTRFDRYGAALERALPFLTTLQYTEANTKHFVEWYRARLLGGFHATHRDGDLRVDQTGRAVCAMIQYVTQVAR